MCLCSVHLLHAVQSAPVSTMADLTWWQEVIKSNDWPGTDERLAVVVACVPIHRMNYVCLCSVLCKVGVLMVSELTSVKQLQATDARCD